MNSALRRLAGGARREFGVGSLAVRNHRGEFGVGGLSDAVRCRPPRVGALVTFSFSGVTANGIPKAAMFKAERPAETVKAERL